MEILFLFVGMIFIELAILLAFLSYYYKTFADQGDGQVIAFRVHDSRNSRNSGVTYSPIIKYSYSGDSYCFEAGGSNIIKHYIGQNVAIRTFPYGHDYVLLEDNILNVFSTVLGGMGLVFSIVFFVISPFTYVSKIFAIAVSVAFPLFIFWYVKIKTKFSTEEIFKKFLKNSTVTMSDQLSEENLILNQESISDLTLKSNKAGMFISTLFLLLSGGTLYYLLIHAPPSVIELFSLYLEDVFKYHLVLDRIKEPFVAGILMSSLFSVMGIYSFIYSWRQLKKRRD